MEALVIDKSLKSVHLTSNRYQIEIDQELGNNRALGLAGLGAKGDPNSLLLIEGQNV